MGGPLKRYAARGLKRRYCMKPLTFLTAPLIALAIVLLVARSSSARSIRDIDFRNFSYSKLPTRKCSMAIVLLRDGKYEASERRVPRKIPSKDCWSVVVGTIEYGDVTGDGKEEAMVVLYAERGGTESSNDVFVYTLKNGKPVVLWKFASGDRADGGLRKIHAEDSKVVVELAGKNKIIGGNLYADDGTSNGDCCPTVFTRTKYQWVGGRFRRRGRIEILPFTGCCRRRTRSGSSRWSRARRWRRCRG